MFIPSSVAQYLSPMMGHFYLNCYVFWEGEEATVILWIGSIANIDKNKNNASI